jgi:alkylation response protein AidB-like acyl-CoA dehydrogenase
MTETETLIEPNSKQEKKQSSFEEFISKFKSALKTVYHEENDINQMSTSRGIAPEALNKILLTNPHTLLIPREYGGGGGSVKDNLILLSAASYESLPLSLTLGINCALFLQPVIKYGQQEAKAPILDRFVNHQNLGGLMITEPTHGTDALNMKTSWTESAAHYHLKGTKHWAGLTGQANFWLLTARKQTENGLLQRDVDMFVSDNSIASQNIVVEEYFENLGLYQIPYGRNIIDVQIPKNQKLIPHTSGVHMMMDLLHRSRLQFPGMTTGFIHRMFDEGLAHCKQRLVGGKSLFSYDHVQHQLSILQANYTISSALSAVSVEHADIKNDLNGLGFEANIVKTVATDLMQQSAQTLVQLVGAAAYKLTHIAGRGTNDSRPFQIFEGANDILYIQIGESLIKQMKNAKMPNLYAYLKSLKLTSRAAEYFKTELKFELDFQQQQRKVMELGYIISRIAAMDLVIKMGDKGFRADMINGAVSILGQEIVGKLSSLGFKQTTTVVDDYYENSQWLNFI